MKIEVDGCLLYSASRKQAVIATSSAEAEVYAAAAGISEATHLVHVIGEMGFETQMVLKIDAAAARGVLHRQGVGKLKHLSVKTLWLQAFVKRGALRVEQVGTKDNKADLGTKTLSEPRLRELRHLLGMLLPEERMRGENVGETMAENMEKDPVSLVAGVVASVLKLVSATMAGKPLASATRPSE